MHHKTSIQIIFSTVTSWSRDSFYCLVFFLSFPSCCLYTRSYSTSSHTRCHSSHPCAPDPSLSSTKPQEHPAQPQRQLGRPSPLLSSPPLLSFLMVAMRQTTSFLHHRLNGVVLHRPLSPLFSSGHVGRDRRSPGSLPEPPPRNSRGK